jgi:hypothetical protein
MPEAKVRDLEAATHGYCWARGGVDTSDFWSAVRKTGVHVAHCEATMPVSVLQEVARTQAPNFG